MMRRYSTRQAAKELRISFPTLSRYIGARKIPVPPVQEIGGGKFRVWSEQDIERVRKLLPKIANGRKTRYQKLRKKQKAQAKKPVPRKPKKK